MPLFNGVLPGIVVDNVDPLGQGRVKVQINAAVFPPRHPGSLWVRMATLTAGDGRGSWFMPDIDDEVLVACDAYDSNLAYVVGALWSDARRPPETMQPGNDKKVLRSRKGVEVALIDYDGQESFVVKTPAGQNVTLRDGPGSVVINDSNGNSLRLSASGITATSSATVRVQDSNGNSLQLEASGITVNAAAKVTVNASIVQVNASTINFNAGLAKFSGVVQCNTLISNSVVSANYTPGAGNIM